MEGCARCQICIKFRLQGSFAPPRQTLRSNFISGCSVVGDLASTAGLTSRIEDTSPCKDRHITTFSFVAFSSCFLVTKSKNFGATRRGRYVPKQTEQHSFFFLLPYREVSNNPISRTMGVFQPIETRFEGSSAPPRRTPGSSPRVLPSSSPTAHWDALGGLERETSISAS